MVRPQDKVTPITNAEGIMTCIRCSATLGKCIDGVHIVAGGIRLFNVYEGKQCLTYFCDRCGKAYHFFERRIRPDEVQVDSAFDKFLAALGNEEQIRENEEENTY